MSAPKEPKDSPKGTAPKDSPSPKDQPEPKQTPEVRRSSSAAVSPKDSTPGPSANKSTPKRSGTEGEKTEPPLDAFADVIEMVRQFLAEFVGTFFLTLFICGSCVITFTKTTLPSQSEPSNLNATNLANRPVTADIDNPDQYITISLCAGLALTSLAIVFGHVSGCHINPAVTVGLLLNGQFPLRRLPVYVPAQLFGGIVGAALLNHFEDGEGKLCPTKLGGPFDQIDSWTNPMKGIIMEMILTCLFLMVICQTCQSNPKTAPLFIGLYLATAHLVGMPYTGASLNPARSLGPGLFHYDDGLKYHYVYWIGPILGGAFGGLLNRYVFYDKATNKKTKRHGESKYKKLPPDTRSKEFKKPPGSDANHPLLKGDRKSSKADTAINMTPKQ